MQETREIRALAIVATTQLRPGAEGWRVPSQSGTGSYTVDPDAGFCSCPDHETRAIECKHILAARLTLRREKGHGGVYHYKREVQVTYSQQWSAYNAAQTEEKGRFLELLADLCRGVPPPRPKPTGRPPTPLSTWCSPARTRCSAASPRGGSCWTCAMRTSARTCARRRISTRSATT